MKELASAVLPDYKVFTTEKDYRKNADVIQYLSESRSYHNAEKEIVRYDSNGKEIDLPISGLLLSILNCITWETLNYFFEDGHFTKVALSNVYKNYSANCAYLLEGHWKIFAQPWVELQNEDVENKTWYDEYEKCSWSNGILIKKKTHYKFSNQINLVRIIGKGNRIECSILYYSDGKRKYRLIESYNRKGKVYKSSTCFIDKVGKEYRKKQKIRKWKLISEMKFKYHTDGKIAVTEEYQYKNSKRIITKISEYKYS